MSGPGYRYGPWHGGPDPLAAPYDVAGALDEIGDAVLAGQSPREALSDLLRRGTEHRHGLDDLRRQVRQRQRAARERRRLDGTLEQVRELLDRAVSQERTALFPDPADDARLREAELDALPRDPARAVRRLADYDWRSPDARETYDQIRDLLRQEVLDSQFRGMKQALQQAGQDPGALSRIKNMLADLNAMLAVDARGEDTDQRFAEFMDSYGDLFPDNPQNLEELVDALARRAAAAQRLLASLSPEQRAELADLMATAMADMDLAREMSALQGALRERRPDLDWASRERMRGNNPMGMGDATDALEELADLDELAATLGQNYPGATLDDVDEEAVARALGRAAADDLEALRRIERALEEQGYLRRERGRLELSPKAIRRIGATALRRVFARLEAHRQGQHDLTDAGAAGELTGRPGVGEVVLALPVRFEAGEHPAQRGSTDPADRLGRQLQAPTLAPQVPLLLESPLNPAQRFQIVHRGPAEGPRHRLLVHVVQGGARVVLTQRGGQFVKVGELFQGVGGIAHPHRVVAAHPLPAGPVQVRAALSQRPLQRAHLPSEIHVGHRGCHEVRQLGALFGGERGQQPLGGGGSSGEGVDQLFQVLRVVREEVAVGVHELGEPLVGVLAPGVGGQHRVEVGEHVLGRGQRPRDLAGLLQRLRHAAELAVQHLLAQQVADLVVGLAGIGRAPVVVGQPADRPCRITGQRVELGLPQPGVVGGIGEQRGALLTDRPVQQLPDLLQRAVQPPPLPGGPLPLPDLPAQVVQTVPVLSATAQQV